MGVGDLLQRFWWCFGCVLLAALFALVPGCAPASRAPADPAPATQPAGATAQQTAEAIARGVAFLERDQRPDGSWGTGTVSHGTEIYSMVPGSQISFRLGTTALCVMALREAGETEAHDKGLNYLLTSPDARRDDGTLLYNTWAHIYVTEAMAEEILHADGKPVDPRIVEVADRNIKHLQQYATYIGGWAYYDFDEHAFLNAGSPTSFGTGAGLVSLYEAKQAGLQTPHRLVKLSLDSLERMREPTGVFMYGEYLRYYPLLPANLPPGAFGRTQVANYALWLWGHPRPTEKDILTGLNYFVADHGVIEMGRKDPVPHESWYQTSGYYYYFDHYYASRLLDALPRELAAKYAAHLRDYVVPHQESDGSWWDFAMWDYHKPYGTAFAVMTLLRCQEALGITTAAQDGAIEHPRPPPHAAAALSAAK
ncbi:MAG TPA: hypothetical protein VHY37_07260 [Tepidisphaeraceae bacterium]|jgi:hypothetical protein|nr:hypothetical protein [Tepidisphaeraceae bacterium]